MNKKILLVALVFLCLFSFNFVSASIENIPVNVSYNSGTNQLSVTGENLYWQKVFDNSTFSVSLNIIRASELAITDLQSSLSNMTMMCNSSMNYLNPLIDCVGNLSRLSGIELAYTNTNNLLTQCNTEKDNLNNQVSQMNTITKERNDAQSQRGLFGVGGVLVGAIGYWFFKVRKKESKDLEEDNEFSPSGRG
jgi:hypothetical protein